MEADKIDVLVRARALVGGVSKLAAKIGIDVYVLDEMLHGTTDIPPWVFERARKLIDLAK